MWYARDVLYAVLYVHVSCFVVRGCGVSRRYIDVCYFNMFSVVNVYLDHLKFCVVIVEGMSVVVNVILSLMSVMRPPPALCNLSVRTAVKLCGTGVLSSTGDVHVRDVGGVCDICMCLARGGVGGEGGEWMRELGLGFTNPVGTESGFSV